MDNKQKYIAMAKETLDIFKLGFYRIKKGTVKVKKLEDYTIANTILYTPKSTDELPKNVIIIRNSNCIIEVTTESTLAASKRLLDEGYNNVVCLNFASAKHPGGGFLKGSIAQEESLSRASGLYPSLITKMEMYDYNLKHLTPLYTDYMIYSPKVPVIRDDNCTLLEEPYCVSMITSPAVNVGAIRNKEDFKQVKEVMLKRIEKILALAIEHKDEAVVLGAYGAGVFRNQPEDVANYFKEILCKKGYKKAFKKIVFGIYGGGKNYEAFKKVFDK